MRLPTAHGSNPTSASRAATAASSSPPISRVNAPIARPSSTGRPAASPFQNGSRPGWPGAGTTSTRSCVMSCTRHEVRAEREDVADPRLVDHLLVELADPPPAALVAAGQEHAEQPAVGDRAAAGHREPLRSGAAAERAVGAVPDQSGSQLGELVARVAAGEHVEHRLVRAARQRRVRRGPPDQVVERLDVPLVDRHHRDDLLGEDVERVARVAGRLDRAVAHALGHDRRRHELAAVLREDHAGADRADLVTGPARRVAARSPPTAGARPGSRGRPRPCRRRARGCWSPPRPAAGRP